MPVEIGTLCKAIVKKFFSIDKYKNTHVRKSVNLSGLCQEQCAEKEQLFTKHHSLDPSHTFNLREVIP